MATAVAIQEAGVYTCRHGDKRLSAEKRRLRAGKANVVKADGSTVYPRLYLTELDFCSPDAHGEVFTLYKFGKSCDSDPREVRSAVITFYGWSESSVFDFYTENTGDIVLGDAVCTLMDGIEGEVKAILKYYCWGSVHKATVGALNGHTETSLLPMILAMHVKAMMSGITTWLGKNAAMLDELQELLTSGSESDKELAESKTKALAKAFCKSLNDLVSSPETPPPPRLEPVFRHTIEQKFPSCIPAPLKIALGELASSDFLKCTPIGAVAASMNEAELMGKLCALVRQHDIFPTRSATKAGSSADALALALGGASMRPVVALGGAVVRHVVVGRASLGSAVPMMARAPMPRKSDGALLPRALDGLRISAGAVALVPPRKPRPSAPGVPRVFSPSAGWFELAR